VGSSPSPGSVENQLITQKTETAWPGLWKTKCEPTWARALNARADAGRKIVSMQAHGARSRGRNEPP
jgi:hypothetical protein